MLQVKHCEEASGQQVSSRDKLLGRNAIRLKGLKVGCLVNALWLLLFFLSTVLCGISMG